MVIHKVSLDVVFIDHFTAKSQSVDLVYISLVVSNFTQKSQITNKTEQRAEYVYVASSMTSIVMGEKSNNCHLSSLPFRRVVACRTLSGGWVGAYNGV